MGEQIAVLSAGVWKIRGLVKQLTGFEPVRWSRTRRQPRFNCVVGWGLKPSSDRARRLARRTDKSYFAMEDGFIRSVSPGADEVPLSLVVDRSGVYYDASSVSDLENLIFKWASVSDPETMSRARAAIRLLQRNKISKYNHAPVLGPKDLGLDPEPTRIRVLVVDQTHGDSSVSFGMADSASFERMLKAAIRENPGAEIIVKTHPEVISGRKTGYLTNLADRRVKVISDDVNPWSLLEIVDRVYVVTSQVGLEALLAGCKVTCFGSPFYSNWGLTDDRVTVFRRKRATLTLEQLFSAIYLDYARYVCPKTKKEIGFEEAVSMLVDQRDRFLSESKH